MLILINESKDALSIGRTAELGQCIVAYNHESNTSTFYDLNKDQAKQVVEHLTKVFEL